MTESFKITSTIETRLEEISVEFDVVKVEIERFIMEITSTRKTVPGVINTCITEAVSRYFSVLTNFE